MTLLNFWLTGVASKWLSLDTSRIVQTSVSTDVSSSHNWIASDIRRLSTDKIVIAYVAATNTGTTVGPYIVVGTINSDNTITFGTAVDVGNVYYSTSGYNANYMFCRGLAILSDTSFTFAWTNSNGDGRIIACTVSGTTITAGSAIDFGSSAVAARYIHCCALDSANVIVSFRNYDSSNVMSRLYTVSGTTMTYRTSVTTSSAIRYDFMIEKIDSTRALLHMSSNGTGGNSRVLSISGTTISQGTSVEIKTGVEISFLRSMKIGSNWLLFYDDVSGNRYLRWASISGSTITLTGSEIDVTSQYPTFTSSTTSSNRMGAPILLDQIGSDCYILQNWSGGGSSTTERPMYLLHKFNTSSNSFTLLKTVYVSSSTTMYDLMDKNTNFYSDPVDQHLVSVGYTVDSGTYILKAFVTQP